MSQKVFLISNSRPRFGKDINQKNKQYDFIATIKEWINLSKDMLVLTSAIFLISINIFLFLDFLLFTNKFHFSYAAYKEFYLSAFDLTVVQFLAFIAFFPILIAITIFVIPYAISNVVAKYFDENNAFSIRLGILYMLNYFILGILLFDLGEKFIKTLNLNNYAFVIFLTIHIALLYISAYATAVLLKYKHSYITITILFIVYNIIEYMLIYIEIDLIIYIVNILLISIPIPIILLFFINVKVQNKRIKYQSYKNKKTTNMSKKTLFSLIIFSAPIAIFYLHSEINDKQWDSLDTNKSSILTHGSFNLFLNRVFLDKNRINFDINVSNYTSHQCISNTEKIHLSNNGKVTVLSLSENKKLYFLKTDDASQECIYAVKIINVKGENVYKLVATGAIKLENNKKITHNKE